MPANKPDSKKLYIIEDDPDVACVLEMLAKLEGFQAVHFSTCDEALEALRTEETIPCMILADYRVSGLAVEEFAEQVRDQPTHLVLVSAVTGVAEKAHELGISHWLKKPFDVDDFVALLHKLKLRCESNSTTDR